MNAEQALAELQALADGRLKAIKGVDRRHSWRPSEKAMTKAFYQRQLDALHFAIGALKMQVIPGTNTPDAGTPAY